MDSKEKNEMLKNVLSSMSKPRDAVRKGASKGLKWFLDKINSKGEAQDEKTKKTIDRLKSRDKNMEMKKMMKKMIKKNESDSQSKPLSYWKSLPAKERDAKLQKIADKNPEKADRIMDSLEYDSKPSRNIPGQKKSTDRLNNGPEVRTKGLKWFSKK